MERKQNGRNYAKITFNLFYFALFVGFCSIMFCDYDYWAQMKSPFYVFLIAQVLIWTLILIIFSTDLLSRKCYSASVVILLFSLVINTIVGAFWYSSLQSEGSDVILLPRYHIIALILLLVPIGLTGLICIILMFVAYFFLGKLRMNQPRQQLEDEGLNDQEIQSEVTDTYMQLMEQVIYDKTTLKIQECAICMKDFNDGETLQMIPNCAHAFHGECLRKWFEKLQNCPLCGGNIIKMPKSQRNSEQPIAPLPPPMAVLNLQQELNHDNAYGLAVIEEENRIQSVLRQQRDQTPSNNSDYGDYRGQSPRQAYNMLSSQQNQISSNERDEDDKKEESPLQKIEEE